MSRPSTVESDDDEDEVGRLRFIKKKCRSLRNKNKKNKKYKLLKIMEVDFFFIKILIFEKIEKIKN